jgi:hypothetical protein
MVSVPFAVYCIQGSHALQSKQIHHRTGLKLDTPGARLTKRETEKKRSVCTNEPTSELFPLWYRIGGSAHYSNSPYTITFEGWLSGIEIDPMLSFPELHSVITASEHICTHQ